MDDSFSGLYVFTLNFIFSALPFVVFFILAKFLYDSYRELKFSEFLSSLNYVLLKITPPQDIFKTPAAMELFLNVAHQPFGDLFGKARPWTSLEMVSEEGLINFYIYVKKDLSKAVESQLYAQYPGIEVAIAEDYTKKVRYPSDKYEVFACELGLTGPDPLPIKTYVDYGLDSQMIKEDQKIDPITATLEFLGSLSPKNYVWIQMIVRAHKAEDPHPQKYFKKTDKWKDDAKSLIKEIRESNQVKDDLGKVSFSPMTKGQQDKISAIERSVSKLSFDCGIRCIYIAEKELFDGVNIGGMLGSFKQYNSMELNGFKPVIMSSIPQKWKDPFGKKLKILKENMFESYVERYYFHKTILGKRRKHFVLNSEELATIFHFPGKVAKIPTMSRVLAKKSEPPLNLPV